MKLRSGIKLLREVIDDGEVVENKDGFDAVLKFYRNNGDPLFVGDAGSQAEPYLESIDGESVIMWRNTSLEFSNVIYQKNRCLAREADVLPGVYYSILGMREGGYRSVSIPPHLFAHTMYKNLGIEKESMIKMECYLSKVTRKNIEKC